VIFNPLPPILEGARFDEILAEMLYLDFRMYLEDNLLLKVDRASMACSLECGRPSLTIASLSLPQGYQLT